MARRQVDQLGTPANKKNVEADEDGVGRRMATKEYNPMGPKQRKAIKFTDRLVEVAYVCESCGTEIKRTIREK